MTPRSPTSRDTATSREIRIERDLLGELAVPADAYYGIHTARSIANFPISGIEVGALTELVVSLAAIKAAAATTNNELGRLDDSRTAAIVGACREIQAGRLHDQFRVDVMQGGAGTSTNMLVNEVVANRGLELLGRPRGDYVFLHPLDHVNLGQSTNDVYPTALRLALYGLLGQLTTAVAKLRSAIGERAVAFAGLPKLGRTELQDAVPMTLGREFGSWATTLREEEQRLEEVALLLCEVNLGGTAIGTSVNAHPAYPTLVCERLAADTGLPLVPAEDLVEATWDTGVFVTVSSTAKRTAIKVAKICDDLRLLSSGPQAGLGEINLPACHRGDPVPVASPARQRMRSPGRALHLRGQCSSRRSTSSPRLGHQSAHGARRTDRSRGGSRAQFPSRAFGLQCPGARRESRSRVSGGARRGHRRDG